MPTFFPMADVPTNPRLWFIVETDKSPTGGVIVRNITSPNNATQLFQDRARKVYAEHWCTGWRPIDNLDVYAQRPLTGYQYNQAKARSG